jgi:hypothetical protein
MSSFNYYNAKRVWSKGNNCLVVAPGQSIQCSGWKDKGDGTNKSYVQCQTELRSRDKVYCHYNAWSLGGNYETELRCVYCEDCMLSKDGFTDQTDILMIKAPGGQSMVTEMCPATLWVYPDGSERNAKMSELLDQSQGDEQHGGIELQ